MISVLFNIVIELKLDASQHVSLGSFVLYVKSLMTSFILLMVLIIYWMDFNVAKHQKSEQNVKKKASIVD